MLNVGGGELLVILLVALIVLGPDKLPEAARQIGAITRQLRKISDGFQSELKAALDDPGEAEARRRGEAALAAERDAAGAPRVVAAPRPNDSELASPAAAAGMYDMADTDVDTDADSDAEDDTDTADSPAPATPPDSAAAHTAGSSPADAAPLETLAGDAPEEREA